MGGMGAQQMLHENLCAHIYGEISNFLNILNLVIPTLLVKMKLLIPLSNAYVEIIFLQINLIKKKKEK